MTDTTPRMPSSVAVDVQSPAFVKAVTELGQRRAVLTAAPILNQQGVKLLEGGVQIDASLYDRLVTHRLAVPLDESVKTDPCVDAAALRQASEEAVERWPLFGLMAPPGRVRSMVLQSIQAIPLPAPIAFQLTLMRETRPALFEHSVLMALLCAHFVREAGASLQEMTVAAGAGLLHDLGMLHIDAGLLAAENRLSGDQLRPLYAHPLTSSMLVARFAQYPKQIARAVLEHHERLDGSGYPRALKGDAISPLGRMLALGEVVTAMFDGERERPEQRVSLLLRASPRRFDPALVPSVHRLLRALPASNADAAPALAETIRRLGELGELLARWHAVAAESAASLEGAARGVLDAVAEQADTLQRTLFEAGASADQLEMLAGADAESDSGLCSELAGLAGELQWQLRSNADQLRRRWRSAVGDTPLPVPIAQWVESVGALEAAA